MAGNPQPVLMRQFKLSVSDGQTPTPQMLEIAGLTSLTHSPSDESADASHFGSAGRTQSLIVSRGDQFTASGLRMEDEDDGTRDPGQARVEALSRQIGQAAIGDYVLQFPGGGSIAFQATASVPLFGGGTNDLSSWEATLTVYGTPQYIDAGSGSGSGS